MEATQAVANLSSAPRCMSRLPSPELNTLPEVTSERETENDLKTICRSSLGRLLCPWDLGGWLVLALGTVLANAAPEGGKTKPERPGADIFEPAPLRKIKIEIKGAALQKLTQDNRRYAPAVFRDGDVVLTNVGIHLKGAAGSFRDFNDRPALTVNFDKFAPSQNWHGLHKIHLNNSVQDGSMLTENICGELFRQAGVPAPRVSNARVELNGRDLGVYVLIEGFDKTFLHQYYKKANGHLYDGGFCQDINNTLQLTGGEPNQPQPELKALAAAAQERDLTRRWEKLQELLDMDRFLSFCALEIMTWDWDGYLLKPNNYKLYWDPQANKITFFMWRIPFGASSWCYLNWA